MKIDVRINGAAFPFARRDELTYARIVELAGMHGTPSVAYQAYTFGGTLQPGQAIPATDGLVITVTDGN